MKKNRFLRYGILLFIFMMVNANLFAQAAKHVVLISIDGFRPEMYLNPNWPAPHLQSLLKQGTYARYMKSVFPSYTYPSHVAMLTGALPARSGIYYNAPMNSKGNWNWFAKDIKAPTLWQALKKAGLRTSAVEWPVSVSTDITWDIPEIWSKDDAEDRITEVRKYATPGLVEEIEQNATGKLDGSNMQEANLSLDANSAKMAGYIFTRYQPALLAVHFAEVDGFEHSYGREGDSVRMAVGAVDKAVGELLSSIEKSGLESSTTILVVGDHGFADIHEVFRPNLLIRSAPAKFVAAGGSAFLYAVTNIDTTELPHIIKQVTDSLNTLPEDKRKLFRIIDRQELDRMGADPSAMMALAAVPGLVFSGSTAAVKITNTGPGTKIQNSLIDGLFIPATGGHHGYDPDLPQMHTGFIACGSGIQKGGVIPELCVTDIAPLIAELLGIEFKAPDGRLVPGIIRNAR